ncbi:MAG TPA: hypothetical protein VJM33_10070 [Microthrixaceae bacterium]|nr:hypothetical protein [Microthrixaceae bacterium]
MVATTRAFVAALALCLCACGRDPDPSAARLERAAASESFCDLAKAVNLSVLDSRDGESVIATYEAFDRAVNDATEFVPPELAAQWPAVVKGADYAARQSALTYGNLNDPGLHNVLTSGEFRTAYDAVDAWVAEHC